MIVHGYVGEDNPSRQAVFGGAQSLVGAQAVDPPPEQWRCFATCVQVAIRGYGLVAYRVAVRRDRYQIGRDLVVLWPMYLGLVHATGSLFRTSQKLIVCSSTTVLHTNRRPLRLATTAGFPSSFAGQRRQCIRSEAVVGIQPAMPASPHHFATAIQTPRPLKAAACSCLLRRHAILPSPSDSIRLDG